MKPFVAATKREIETALLCMEKMGAELREQEHADKELLEKLEGFAESTAKAIAIYNSNWQKPSE